LASTIRTAVAGKAARQARMQVTGWGVRRCTPTHEVVDHCTQAGGEQALLVVLPAVKGNALGILPHSHQAVPAAQATIK
jgi:tRNA G37 N-methylase TrmD